MGRVPTEFVCGKPHPQIPGVKCGRDTRKHGEKGQTSHYSKTKAHGEQEWQDSPVLMNGASGLACEECGSYLVPIPDDE